MGRGRADALGLVGCYVISLTVLETRKGGLNLGYLDKAGVAGIDGIYPRNRNDYPIFNREAEFLQEET